MKGPSLLFFCASLHTWNLHSEFFVRVRYDYPRFGKDKAETAQLFCVLVWDFCGGELVAEETTVVVVGKVRWAMDVDFP